MKSSLLNTEPSLSPPDELEEAPDQYQYVNVDRRKELKINNESEYEFTCCGQEQYATQWSTSAPYYKTLVYCQYCGEVN